jgi:hypothetical protein
MVETSANSNAAEIALAEATERFKSALDKTIRVKYRLPDSAQRSVIDMVGAPVAFGDDPLFSSHAVLASVREVVREVYSRLTMSRLSDAVLVIGSSAREMKLYANCPGIEHYVHGGEAKDVERVARQLLAKIAVKARQTVSKGEKIERSYTQETLYREYGRTIAKKAQDFIHTEFPNRFYNTLFYEDSFYNLGWEDYFDHFNRTGASMAWGYGILPLELKWADMPPNKHYSVRTSAGRAFFSYRYGEENGYNHDYHRWSTFLHEPYRSFGPFALTAEIKCRMGPFVIFTITKSTKSERVSRTVEIPEKYQYVRVLDVAASARGTAFSRSDKWFSVKTSEAYEAINFAMSLADKSLTPEGVMTMIRRRSPGVSLTTQQLIAPWELPEHYHYRLAVAAYAYAFYSRAHSEDALKKIAASPILSMLKDQLSLSTFAGRNLLFKQKPSDMLDRLVVHIDGFETQEKYIKVVSPTEQVYTLRTEGVVAPTVTCDLCNFLLPRLGKQKVKCECEGRPTEVTFSLRQEELTNLENELIDTDNDPMGLAKIKDRAKLALPKSAFSKTVKIHYIRGGPGTGKSYVIRQLATERDLIVSPLVKLRTDYVNLVRPDGSKYDLNFATTHRALEKKNCPRVFLDEYTLFDYRYLACLLHNTGADELYLAGDHAQTHIQSEHGVPIGARIDLEALPRHTLLVNFRNPIEIVDILNRNYGYNMVAASGVHSNIVWANPKTYQMPQPKPEGLHYFAFTHKECADYEIDKDATVKTSQGSTYDDVVLFLTEASQVARMKPMQVVALSRHKKSLTIVGPPAVREELFPSADYPEGGFPDDRVVLEESKPVEVKITQDTYERDEGLDPAPSLERPVLLTLTSRTLVVNYWTLLLLAKALFHLCVELGSGGHVLRSVDLISTGLLNKHLAADVSPHYFIFVVNMFVYRAILKWFYRYLFWVMSIISIVSPFPVDAFDRSFAYYITTDYVLYAVNVTGYAVFMYKLWRLSRVKGSAYWSFDTRKHLTLGFDLESGRFTGTVLPKSVPLWASLPHSFKDMHFLTPWSGKEVHSPADPTCHDDVEGESPVSRDSHLLLADLLPRGVAVEQFLSAMNEWTSLAVRPAFRNGRLRITDLVAPLNRRGNMKTLVRTFRSFSVGNGVKFWDSPMQTLGVLAERYLTAGRPRKDATTSEQSIVADAVANLFFEEHMTAPSYTITDDDIEIAFSEYIPKAIRKHYPNQVKDINDPDTRLIRMHIKQIMKPASEMRPLNLLKAGQGISAWDKNAQIIFGTGALVVYKKFRDGLASHVVFDNGMTQTEMKTKLRAALKRYGSIIGSTNCIADGEMFDANQDNFTQLLEAAFYRRLGASAEWVDFYMSHRKDYVIATPYATGRASTEKTSGEPFTLLGNTIVSAAISNYLFRGSGPVMLSIKGDDFWKRQVGIRPNISRVNQLAKCTRLKMKSYVSDSAEFVGYTIVGSDFIESIPRKFAKVSGHEFRNYEHFTEYQKSLRDWVAETRPLRPLLEAGNAKLFNLPLGDVAAMYDTMVALSHINEEQYAEISREYVRFEAVLVGPGGVAM